MSGISLDETLFYQYLIDHNSTSTMLNALSGSSSDDNNSMDSVLGGLQSVNGFGTGSISDISTILGRNGGDDGSVSSLGGFSSILQAYLNQDTAEMSEMVEKLEEVLEETAGTEEEGSKSWQTVQELYQYFSEAASGRANPILEALSSSGESSGGNEDASVDSQAMPQTADAVFDFDSVEQESDAMIDSLMEEMEVAY